MRNKVHMCLDTFNRLGKTIHNTFLEDAQELGAPTKAHVPLFVQKGIGQHIVEPDGVGDAFLVPRPHCAPPLAHVERQPDMLLQHKVDEKRVCSRKELERVAPRHVAEEVGEGNGGAGVIPPIEPVDLFGVVEQGCTDCRRVVRRFSSLPRLAPGRRRKSGEAVRGAKMAAQEIWCAQCVPGVHVCSAHVTHNGCAGSRCKNGSARNLVCSVFPVCMFSQLMLKQLPDPGTRTHPSTRDCKKD